MDRFYCTIKETFLMPSQLNLARNVMTGPTIASGVSRPFRVWGDGPGVYTPLLVSTKHYHHCYPTKLVKSRLLHYFCIRIIGTEETCTKKGFFLRKENYKNATSCSCDVIWPQR